MEWMIKCVSKPDTSELRKRTIDAHRDYLDGFKDETWYSGPMMLDDGSDANGSFRIIDFPSRGAAQTYILEDPYNQVGLFETIAIERLVPWTSLRQRDYARKEGTAQYVVIARAEPGPAEAEPPAGSALSGFLDHNASCLLAAGSLTRDDGTVATGALYLIDVADGAAAERFADAEPVSRGAGGKGLTVERWRFGHV